MVKRPDGLLLGLRINEELAIYGSYADGKGTELIHIDGVRVLDAQHHIDTLSQREARARELLEEVESLNGNTDAENHYTETQVRELRRQHAGIVRALEMLRFHANPEQAWQTLHPTKKFETVAGVRIPAEHCRTIHAHIQLDETAAAQASQQAATGTSDAAPTPQPPNELPPPTPLKRPERNK